MQTGQNHAVKMGRYSMSRDQGKLKWPRAMPKVSPVRRYHSNLPRDHGGICARRTGRADGRLTLVTSTHLSRPSLTVVSLFTPLFHVLPNHFKYSAVPPASLGSTVAKPLTCQCWKESCRHLREKTSYQPDGNSITFQRLN